MDKDYNVDDILSEIKNRKSRGKAGQLPEQPARGAAPDFRIGTFGDSNAVPDGFEPPVETPSFGDGFQFDLPDKDAESQTRPNPMDFTTGHVRPLTDKARIRGSRIGQRGGFPAEQDGFDFQLPEDNPPRQGGAVEHVDFSAFRSSGDEGQEHTRVLPRLVGGQDDNTTSERTQSGTETSAAGEYAESYYEDDIHFQDDIPEQASVDFSEYNSVKDRRDVATDIARVKLWLFIRTGVTTLLTGLLLYLALAGKYVMPLPAALEPEGETVRGYLVACTILTALVALVNSSSVGGGILSLFKGRANSDTLVSFAMLGAIAQVVIAAVNSETADPTLLNLYFFIAALAMLFNALGKMTMINRIQLNFRIIASDRKKKALLAVDNDDFCREFVPEAVRRPTIAYSAGADFFTDFLGLSYSDKYDVGINRAVAPVCIVAAILVGTISYVFAGDLPASLSAATAVLCVSATLSSTFIENIPLGKLTKALHPIGGMVSGNKAVEDFCDTEAIILTETDLFPEGNVRLTGIKSFSQGRIDDAIIDAASVMCALSGALSPVFLQMIGGNKKLLKKVDNIVYENGMGVSAWVASRRVLIGNRQLMVNHGIPMPPMTAKATQLSAAPEEGDMLYLSNSGEVSAQFGVSYHIDEDLAGQLDLLAARDKRIIVYTCDANITPHRIWELYGYPENLITILPAERHVQYRRMSEHRENAVAEIAYNGNAAAMVGSVIACMNARSSILSATVIQLIQIILGYGLVAFMAFMGAIGSLSILQICVYQVFWFLAIFIVQKVKQP